MKFPRWLLPRSLTRRVFLLYAATLSVFIMSGLGFFLRYQFLHQVEETQRSSVMLIEVVAQAVQDSAVIGDYDTVRKTLDKAVQGSLFSSVAFIDSSGGKVQAHSRELVQGQAPGWLVNWIETHLFDVNRPVSVGGRTMACCAWSSMLPTSLTTCGHSPWQSCWPVP